MLRFINSNAHKLIFHKLAYQFLFNPQVQIPNNQLMNNSKTGKDLQVEIKESVCAEELPIWSCKHLELESLMLMRPCDRL